MPGVQGPSGEEVEAMFAAIAPKYDRANTVLSLGVHHGWRRRAVRKSGATDGSAVLDLACGTGDLTFAFKRRVGDGRVVGSDFCEPMLEVARAKATKRGQDVAFQWADAQELPFGDDEFDVASISFGIRNVHDPAKAVGEMARTVKSGGRVVILEFGQPRGPIGVPYRIYSQHVMPRLGGLITGNRAAYEYLPRTAAEFPCGTDFVDLMLGAADFETVTATPLTGGIAWLYVGTVA